MNFAALLVLALAAVASAVEHPFTSCSANNVLGISSLDFSEDPIVQGDTVTATVTGLPTATVSGGTIEYKVMHGKIKLYGDTVGLCDDPDLLKCPIAADTELVISMAAEVPASLPKATVSVHATFYDEDGNVLSCIDTDVKITKNKSLRGGAITN